jgi:hypothetical protein
MTASSKLNLIAALFALNACGMLAQDVKLNYTAVNVADSTQGFSGLSQFPPSTITARSHSRLFTSAMGRCLRSHPFT